MDKGSIEKLKFFLYARKSSDEEDRQVQSIDDQLNNLTKLAQSLNLEIIEVYTEAKTAKVPYCRAVFSEMVKRIEKGEANGILCWHVNRLFRNPVDFGTISWMLQLGTIRFIQTMERQYVPEDNVLLLSVEGGMANQYIIDLRKSCMRGMVGKAQRGWLPSRAPLGYANNKLENNISVDTERFPLVRKMWELMLTGNYTPSMILKIANKEWGFRTPKTKREGGKELSSSVIYKMFTNVFYTGNFEWNGSFYNGKHTPIISIDEYDRVQVILGKKGKPRLKKHVFAFTGIIRCGDCGGMITATEKVKLVKRTGEVRNYIYYHCTHKMKGAVCTQRNPLTVQEIDDEIERFFMRFTILPEFRQWALDWLKMNNAKEVENRSKAREMCLTTLSETQKELDNLTRMRYKEYIDDSTFMKESNLLKGNIAQLKQQLETIDDKAEKWIELTERTFNFATYARVSFQTGTPEIKRELFTALGQNFSLKDKKLNIDAVEWLAPIEKAYPAIEAEYKRLELQKTLSNEMRNMLFTDLILRWRAVVEVIRTGFLTRNDSAIYIPLVELPKKNE